MNRQFAVDSLAGTLCRVLDDERNAQRAWIAIDEVGRHIGIHDVNAINAAVAFAAAKGWIEIAGEPAQSVLLRR